VTLKQPVHKITARF